MKKTFAILGMTIAILVVVFGILTLCGVFGEAYAKISLSRFDSGYASFASDFYTYSVNNTAEVAVAARVTACNARELADMLQAVVGGFLICFGLLMFCGIGIIYADCVVRVAKRGNTVAEFVQDTLAEDIE